MDDVRNDLDIAATRPPNILGGRREHCDKAFARRIGDSRHTENLYYGSVFLHSLCGLLHVREDNIAVSFVHQNDHNEK